MDDKEYRALTRKRVSYEWATEEVHTESGDIEAVYHADTYKGALCNASDPALGCHFEIALTRIVHSDDAGIIERLYAYMVDGKLPEKFDGGDKVPAKYHKQVADNGK